MRAPAQLDAAAFAGIAHRVEQQVGQRAVDLLLAAEQAPRLADRERDPLAPGRQRFAVALDARQQLGHRQRQVILAALVDLQPRQQQQVVDQVLHARGLLLHAAKPLGQARRQQLGGVGVGFQVAGQYGQRRPQLVGDVGDEVAAHLLEAVQAGDVARHHQALVVAVQGDLELQHPTLVHRRGQRQRLPVGPGVEVGHEARVADQVGDVLAAVVGGLQPQHRLGGAVPPLKVAVGVEHHHAVAHRLGGFLDALEGRLQAALGVALTLLVAVEAIEQVAPQAGGGGRFVVGAADQPVAQGVQLAQVVGQAGGQAHREPQPRRREQPADQAAGGSQQADAPDLPAPGAHVSPCWRSGSRCPAQSGSGAGGRRPGPCAGGGCVRPRCAPRRRRYRPTPGRAAGCGCRRAPGGS